MAQQRKSAPKKKTTQSKPKTSAPKAAQKTPKNAPVPSTTIDERSHFSDYFHAFTKSRFFKPVLIVLVILIVFGIDLLISFNNYDKFFKIWGIEMIVAAVILAIALALSSNKHEKKEVDDNAS